MKTTKTNPHMVKEVFKILGSNGVIHHPKMKNNEFGQSGTHTFANDMIDIVLNSKNEGEAYKRIREYLEMGKIDIVE